MGMSVVLGAAGYHLLGEGRWTWGDCFYMTIITLSTVGYGETLPGMHEVPFVRAWTAGLILCGTGILLYWVSAFTAVIVDGDLRGLLRSRRLQKAIDGLRNHVIVCGAGTTGVHAIRELVDAGTQFVVLDHDEGRLNALAEEVDGELLYLVGDAAGDPMLLKAGIERAMGVLVMLHEDRDNLFCTLSARALNANVRIISKAVEHSALPKLLRAGADRVVSPNFIGGLRLASEMVRPSVVEFLDTMLRGDEKLRIEEVKIPDGTPLAGAQLRHAGIRDATNALVLAMRDPQGGYHFNPGPDFIVQPGMTMIVLAHMEEVLHLRQGILDGSIGAG